VSQIPHSGLVSAGGPLFQTTGPYRAVALSVVGLVFTYLAISVAAQSVRGLAFLAEHNEDVLSATANVALGNPLDKVVLFAVCTSAVAGSPTIMVITSRTAYSMARAKALPGPERPLVAGLRHAALIQLPWPVSAWGHGLLLAPGQG